MVGCEGLARIGRTERPGPPDPLRTRVDPLREGGYAAGRSRGRPRRGKRGRALAFRADAVVAEAATRACSSLTTSAGGTNGEATTLASLSDAAATGRPSTSATTAGACRRGFESSAESFARTVASRSVAARREMVCVSVDETSAMVWEAVMGTWWPWGVGAQIGRKEPAGAPHPLRAQPPAILRAMRFWSHDRHGFPLPRNHRFPLPKYRLLREAGEREGLGEVRGSEAAPWALLARVHDPAYLGRVRRGELTVREERALGLPWSPELVERGRRSTFGTVHAARDALAGGLGMNLGGGTHHAAFAQGRGYCLFNDVVVAIAALRSDGAAGRVLVVDCDVHQGDGTAELLGGDDTAYTLSLHGGANYPFHRAA